MTAKAKYKARKGTALARRGGLVPAVSRVATEIRDLIETARSHVSVTANLALVNLYWNIGRIITQDIQKNEKRAEYGTQLMEQLARLLTQDYGQGYSVHNLRDMKCFFESYEIRQTVSAESSKRILINFRQHFRLGWSHYRLLLSEGDPVRQRFYFVQAANQRWAVRELRRQIYRGLFERVALSKDTRQLVVQEKRKGPAEVIRYEDIFKDPYVLDFLGLKEHDWHKGENEPVGLILCTSARRQHVELLLRHGPHKMKVAEYRTHLPDKRVLEERLRIYDRMLQKGEVQ